MTTIKTTVDAALPSGAQAAYPFQYTTLLESLTERDYKLTDQITDVVVREFSVNRDTVRDQLAKAGMAVRPAPEPAFTPQDSAEWEKELTQPAVTSAPNLVDVSTFLDTEALKATAGKKGKKNSVKALAKQVKKLTKLARQHGMTV